MRRFLGTCAKYRLSSRTAAVGHYRRPCPENCASKDFLEETSLLSHVDAMAMGVNTSLRAIATLPEH